MLDGTRGEPFEKMERLQDETQEWSLVREEGMSVEAVFGNHV
jgi:hypothetical protein